MNDEAGHKFKVGPACRLSPESSGKIIGATYKITKLLPDRDGELGLETPPRITNAKVSAQGPACLG
jgi:hypothetical protein